MLAAASLVSGKASRGCPRPSTPRLPSSQVWKLRNKALAACAHASRQSIAKMCAPMKRTCGNAGWSWIGRGLPCCSCIFGTAFPELRRRGRTCSRRLWLGIRYSGARGLWRAGSPGFGRGGTGCLGVSAGSAGSVVRRSGGRNYSGTALQLWEERGFRRIWVKI